MLVYQRVSESEVGLWLESGTNKINKPNNCNHVQSPCLSLWAANISD